MKLNHSLFLIGIITILLPKTTVYSQERIPLNQGVYNSWKNLDRPQISNDGKLISFVVEPQLGDGFLVVQQSGSSFSDTIQRAVEAIFSPDNTFIAYKVKTPYQIARKAKLDGKKKDDLPKDSLGISSFNKKTYRFAGLKSFGIPTGSGNCLATLIETPKPEMKKDSSVSDSVGTAKNEEVSKSESESKGIKKKKDKIETFTLKLIYPADSLIFSWDSVTDFALSNQGSKLAWTSYKNDSIPHSSVSIFETSIKKRKDIFKGAGYIHGLAMDTVGNQIAFLQSSDTTKAKRYRLYYYSGNALRLAADTVTEKLTKGFSPGENGKVYFSQDGTKLYFGIAPTPVNEPKDTLTDDEKARVDVWNWKDPLLQPQQLKDLDNEKKRTFLTVYHPKTGKIIELANEEVKTVHTGFKGNGQYALGFAEDPYLIETSWKDANYRDVYLIDNESGTKELLLKMQNGPVSLSSTQKYLSWYNQNDSLWYTMDLKQRRKVRQSAGKSIAFFDEEHDVPSIPGPAGYAGWTENDHQFVVYDQFDLWGLDPSGKREPENLSKGEGRKNNIRFRNIALNSEVPYIGNAEGFLLKGFDEISKDDGYYRLNSRKFSLPESLEKGPYKYSNPTKAKDADVVIWTKGSFSQFPDLWMSNLDFTNQQKLSDANPQQNDYLWGSVKLVHWDMPDGKPAEGLLYMPAGFDSTKTYPMLVYFYEKYSDQLNQHYVPKPSRSIISPTYCTSNGYLVFMPDIAYHDGFPGQSAYDAVISGTEAMISKGFVDIDHMGMQGQSWGGYQTAWLVTRTNLFKAAMAGAPVSNMTSAYGGIRWGSGMVRQFQYEEGQSRIGATLWERPDLYIENSPLFKADKVETPLLIMSNDGDGAVPWYQGIEFFTALRRLGKPAWLLNYNGDEHNLVRRANMKDLDQRMMQFFDHYLKNAPAPEWMINGVPAIDKGKKSGFETAE